MIEHVNNYNVKTTSHYKCLPESICKIYCLIAQLQNQHYMFRSTVTCDCSLNSLFTK